MYSFAMRAMRLMTAMRAAAATRPVHSGLRRGGVAVVSLP